MQVNGAAETHDLKRAEVENGNVAIATQNGTKDGKFNFLALAPGKTKIRFRVAHSKTFVITELEAALEVV